MLTPYQVKRLKDLSDQYRREWRAAGTRTAMAVAQAKTEMLHDFMALFGIDP